MKKNEKTVDDEGSTPKGACDKGDPSWPGKEIRCHFCGLPGVVVAQFPRRGYGGRVFPGEIVLAGCF